MKKPKQVKIPFRPYFRQRMLNGTKTATTRPRRFGQAGDTFQAFGATFTLHQVLKVPLFSVAERFHYQEGFGTPREFQDCWVSIHPKKGWDGSQQVYLHLFERTDNGSTQEFGKSGIRTQGTLEFD